MAVLKAGELHDLRGFTLIELLVVCGILAALSFIAWGGYAGVREKAADDIAHAELARLAQALRRFRADTGHYPGQGPFALAAIGTVETHVSSTRVDCNPVGGILRSWARPAADADRDAWFRSPANLAVLFEAPALCGNHPLHWLNAWHAERRRGWHGPYLDRAARAWVDVGADFNGGGTAPDGDGSPLAGSKIVDVPGFGAGPALPPAGPTGKRCDDAAIETGTCLLGWRSLRRDENGYDADRHELGQHPRPFAVFGLDDGDHPRVVYWGADGRYGGRNALDPCRPNAADSHGKDDAVICLESE